MKKILNYFLALALVSTITSCEDSDDVQPTAQMNLTGSWVNVADPNDILTFKADKSGDYSYRYIDAYEADGLTPIYYYHSNDFDLYFAESNSDGGYDLSFFGEAFPISNASFKLVDGYLKITYDWSDLKHPSEWVNVVEAYKRVE